MKLIKRKYKERQQPEHRRKLGQLEKQKDALKRLKILRQNNKKKLKLELHARKKTGNEYFFKMNVCENFDGEIIPINNRALTQKERQNLIFEKSKIEKKLQKILPKIICKKINLETGETIEIENSGDAERDKYEKKLHEINKMLDF